MFAFSMLAMLAIVMIIKIIAEIIAEIIDDCGSAHLCLDTSVQNIMF